jgi:hypothetical protein
MSALERNRPKRSILSDTVLMRANKFRERWHGLSAVLNESFPRVSDAAGADIPSPKGIPASIYYVKTKADFEMRLLDLEMRERVYDLTYLFNGIRL